MVCSPSCLHAHLSAPPTYIPQRPKHEKIHKDYVRRRALHNWNQVAFGIGD